MISLQTNVISLQSQQDLNINTAFQNNTIQQLSSGYRINSSADDPAGLAVANQYTSDTVELQQGVRNANDGLSQLQIVDGGLGNISQILNQMKTLATESATSTFTGNRATLEQSYSSLVGEITRQAQNIQLNAGGNLNKVLSVFIGGNRTSNVSGTGAVSIDLSGTTNAVDAASLGLANTSVGGGTVGGVDLTGNVVANRLDNPGSLFLAGSGTQTYTFNYADANGNSQTRSVVVSGGSAGIDGTTVLSQLNQGLAGTGITASVDATNGRVQFTGADAFTVGVGAASAGNATATNASTAVNTAQYNLSPAGQVYTAGTNEQFTVSDGTNTVNLTLAGAGDTTAAAVAADINAQLRGAGTPITGVTALVNGDGASVSFQSASNFTVTETLASTDSTGVFVGGAGNQAVTAATTGGTAGTDAEAAIAAINAAVTNLGLVQGSVGSGENTLNYAISLAQSQVTNYTAAESQIKDADVAAEAANLTKAQVLQQASIAAMAQANSSPEAVLKLLQ